MTTRGGKSITLMGLAALAILFLVINMASNIFLTGVRADLTSNKLYTLTEGTRNIVAGIDEPITIYLFYSDKASERAPLLRTYATRVEELLREYVQLSEGNIFLHIVDPVPYSEEEDQAAAIGLQAMPIGNTGKNIYFGLVANNAVGDTEIIEFLQPQREQFLEYDITKLIHTLTNPKKAVIGIITQLPMFGGFDIETTRMTKEWAIIAQMRQLFELRQLDVTTKQVDKDVDILMVVHPKNLAEPALYAIDQFVMRGGRVLFFVDPHSEIDVPVREQNSPLEVEGGRSSNVKWLFDAWGVEYDPTSVVLDRKYALTVSGERQRESRHYALLGIRQGDINNEDIISSELELISVGIAGHIKAKQGADIRVIPVFTSSSDAMLTEATHFRFLPDLSQLSDNFRPTGERYTLMGRVQGQLDSAFPDGRPVMDEEDAPDHLMNTQEDANFIVIADTDALSDRMWVQAQEFFGQRIFNAWANNGDLIINAIDNLTGSSDLISIRGREVSSRPFIRVQELRLAADQNFRVTEQSLQVKLEEAEQKLVKLQKQRDDNNDLMLSPEQEAEIQKFQQEKFKVRKQLRQVRHTLDLDIERLGTQLKFINIGLVPIIISILALILSVLRSRKRKRALGL